MNFISGILGGKKKNGDFFLELKEKPDEPMPSAKSEPVAVSNNGAKATATTQIDTAVKEENGKVKEVKSKSAKSAKAKAAAKKKAEKEAAKEVAPVVNQVLPTAKKVEEEPKETAFASKYLIPKSDGMRRRPGANMNSFLEMASKAKTPIQK